MVQLRKTLLSYIRELFINQPEIGSKDFKQFILKKNYEKFLLLILFAIIISFIMLVFSEISGDDRRITLANSSLLIFSIIWLLPMFIKKNQKISDWLFFIPICALLAYVSYLLGNFSYRSEFFSTYSTSMFIIAVIYTTSWQKTLLLFSGSMIYLYFFTHYVQSGPLSYSSVNSITVFNILFTAWFVSRIVYLSTRKEYENKVRIQNAMRELEKENNRNLKIVNELQDLKIELEDIIKDRTKELQNEKSKAEMSDKTKSLFLTNMSHEIRTPLSGIIGTLEMLNNKNVSEEEKKSLLEMAVESTQQLNGIVDDILEIGSLRSGRYEVVNELFDPVELFMDSIGHFKIKALSKGLKFTVKADEFEEGLCAVSDPKRIKLVLDNVIGNAVKFTDKGYVFCSMSFKTEKEKTFIIFRIEDSGIGINKEIQESLFEFFSSEGKEFGNTQITPGLGLTLTREYIRKLEGKISLESNKDKGTVFTIVVPVDTASGKKMEREKKDSVVIGDIKSVLIVEDNRINRFLLKKILEEKHYEVIEAENGEIAVEEYIKYDIDAVLMDIQMPVMDGYTALAKMRKLVSYKYIPVIAITGYASSDDKNDIIKSGFDAYLPKPFDKKNLLDLLEDLKNRGGKNGD